MPKIKASELTAPALDWAVAKCEGIDLFETEGWLYAEEGRKPYRPSTDWALAGPIIEREEIGIRRHLPCLRGREWEASPSISAKGAGGKICYGPTPLIAAMRCYVASRMTDEVEVPEVLL